MTAKTAEERRHDFLIIEHSGLLEKISHAATDLYRTETVIPLAMAVIYAWLYRSDVSASHVPGWAWSVPIIIAVFGAWRQLLRYISLWGMHEYLRKIETELYGEVADDLCRGWENYWLVAVHPEHQFLTWKVTSHGVMRTIFWALLIVGSTVLAVRPATQHGVQASTAVAGENPHLKPTAS